ncbi:lipopolysaccharide biosynthesis protein [uncultured Erythrobacter sp.]|uniref:lipopolysaccharide biosynthesis protein n=1 Tax=uncultured Erythrobacter sp. TaxID=263913 RepID=UPI0026141064|nr:lipopolysaccharide biosynthesis protein [uncultured Erythrobacter sp.]
MAAQIITWTSTILVVRLLEPTDYGLFAMSQVVITALAFLNGSSFATSLVQTERIDERRIAQVFGLLLLFNGSMAAIQFVSAPLAAAYFREPLVADMLRIQAVIFLTVPFTALPSELLARRLEFRKQGQVNMATAVIGAVTALTLAWFDYGVWALVYAPIAMFVTRAIGLSIAARLLVRPIFDPRGAWDLVTFGGTLTLCQLFWIVQSQSDIVIAGRLLPTYDLGLYSEALFLTLIVTGRFIPPINEVALAAYSELHRAKKSLGPYFLRTARMVMMVSAPIYVGLALTSEAAILTLFGDKWAGMIPVVGGLAMVMPAFALQLICSPVTNAMGRPKVYLSTSMAGAFIMPIAFLWGVNGGLFGDETGAMGLVHAWWIAAPALCIFTLTMTLPRIGVSPLALLRELAPIALACAAMVIAVIGVQRFASFGVPWLDLAWNGFVGASVYAATFWFGYKPLVLETWALLRNRETSPEPIPSPA